MKLFLMVILLFIAGCKESEEVWDELTETERQAIRDRARLQCVRENQDAYDDFKDNTAKAFSSKSYARNKGYEYTLTEDTSTKLEAELRVWKQDLENNVIYFYVNEGVYNYFLKVSLSQNEDIIDDLFLDHCDKNYTASAASSLSITNVFESDSTTGYDEYSDAYVLKSNEPVVLGRFNLTRTIKSYNEEDTQVGNTITHKSSFKEKTYTSVFVQEVYTAFPVSHQRFCEVSTNTLDSPARYRLLRTKGTGFYNSIEACPTTLPSGWDLTVDLN